MKKNNIKIGLLSLIVYCGMLLLSVSCQGELSSFGGSVRPPQDILSSRVDSITLEARTVAFESIYSKSNYALLGDISDPLYGDLRTSYISRLQCAPGFRFSHQPVDNKVDSVFVTIDYIGIVGDSTVWQKAQVFEVTQPLPATRYSGDITPYTQGAKWLGAVTYTPQNKRGIHSVRIRVPNELGERFLKASINHPEYFETQQAFEQNLLKGLYVQPSTGTGAIISVYNTNLAIHYSYHQKMTSSKGTDSIARVRDLELFANSKSEYIHNAFDHHGLDKLKAANPSFTYVKAPAGVVTQLVISKEQLSSIYASYKAQPQANNKPLQWVVSDVQLKTKVNTPDVSSRFSPPTYLLLLPQDSVKTFFEKNETDVSRPRTAFLSNPYSISSRYYDFSNIARLVDEHIKQHGKTDASGKAVVDADLVMLLIPVQRGFASGTTSGQTMLLYNYVYPAAVRLDFSEANRRLGIVSTGYYQR